MARQRGARKVPEQRCQNIYDMHCIGVRIKAMSKHYNTPYSTVCNILRRHKRLKDVSKKRMARPRKLSPRGMRLLQRYVIEYCFDPLYVTDARFNAYFKLQLSVSTFKQAPRRMDIQYYVAIQKPYLSKRNIAKRIIWVRTHQHWTVQQGSNVMYTDNYSFTVRPTKNRLHVRRQRGQRLSARYNVSTFKSGFQDFLCMDGHLSYALLDVSISICIGLSLITTFYHLCLTCTVVLLPLFYRRATEDRQVEVHL